MAQQPPVTNVSARYYGPAGGTTTWYYWVQAIYPSGRSALSLPANTGAKSQAALNSSAFNQVQWNAMPGAIGYLVFSNTTGTTPASGGSLLAILTSETGIKDDGTSWVAQTATPKYEGLYVQRAIYDFAVDGGAIGAITPAISDIIPNGAIVIGATINAPIAILSAGAATISIGTTAGSSAASILAATGKASFSIDAILNFLAGTGPFGAASFKMTAAGQINITVAAAALTAGRIEIYVYYILTVNP